MSAKEPKVPRWPGFYPGRVVDNNDPEKSGRLRIRYGQVTGNPALDDGEIQDEQLPWAFPCFPVPGVQNGEYHVPPVGAQVWVSWFGGSAEYPIWFGGAVPTSELPSAFSSSYQGDDGPTTRYVENAGEQIFEMRWKDGEKKIRLEMPNGVKIEMLQDDESKGPKIVMETPLGFKVTLDEKLRTAKIETANGLRAVELNETVPGAEFANIRTPTQRVEILDAPPGIINIVTTGTVSIGQVGGTKKTLVNTGFLPKYDGHTHLYSPGPSPPTQTGTPSIPSVGTDASVDTLVS